MAFQSSLKQRLLSWRTRRQAVDGTGNRTKSETKQIRNTTPSLSSSGPLHSEQGYTAAPASAPSEEEMTEQVHTVVIAGAGIVGLVLALALDKRTGIKADLYEQAEAFHDDVGAGMGMYPNGLRVIRDISPTLLGRIQQEGYPYQQRRWEVSSDHRTYNPKNKFASSHSPLSHPYCPRSVVLLIITNAAWANNRIWYCSHHVMCAASRRDRSGRCGGVCSGI